MGGVGNCGTGRSCRKWACVVRRGMGGRQCERIVRLMGLVMGNYRE